MVVHSGSVMVRGGLVWLGDGLKVARGGSAMVRDWLPSGPEWLEVIQGGSMVVQEWLDDGLSVARWWSEGGSVMIHSSSVVFRGWLIGCLGGSVVDGGGPEVARG